ncbi:hypothetical protein, partial [Burkholderia gladioli]|uniref:hypothetical protein n=1 Tax=Burkholderia gladioli TaxID=28095 RepID=UPI0019D71069
GAAGPADRSLRVIPARCPEGAVPNARFPGRRRASVDGRETAHDARNGGMKTIRRQGRTAATGIREKPAATPGDDT